MNQHLFRFDSKHPKKDIYKDGRSRSTDEYLHLKLKIPIGL